MPNITLWFLQSSRCIRTAWLLEELGLEYEVRFSDRQDGLAPEPFKKAIGGRGKFPVLQDGSITVTESGNITEYLCDTYDKQHRLLPAVGDAQRYEILQWVHAAEASLIMHAVPILYSRWHQVGGDFIQTEDAMSHHVIQDLDFLEGTLSASTGRYLLGGSLTAADFNVHWSVDVILAWELGIRGKSWPKLEQYVKDCYATESYQVAVRRTGYRLDKV